VRRSTYTEDGQQDVDEKVGVTPALEENTQRREDDSKDDLAKVAERSVSKLNPLFGNGSAGGFTWR